MTIIHLLKKQNFEERPQHENSELKFISPVRGLIRTSHTKGVKSIQQSQEDGVIADDRCYSLYICLYVSEKCALATVNLLSFKVSQDCLILDAVNSWDHSMPL